MTLEFTIQIGVATLCLRIPGLKLKAIKLTELVGNEKMYNG
jgi:hypothetical protein